MFDHIHKKQNTPELDAELADLMLSKVLDNCDAEPNTTPLTTLESYGSLKKERFILQKVILILIMIAWLLLPLAFDVPKLTLTQTSASENTSQPVYELQVSSFIDVKRVVATIDGSNLPVYETRDNVYTVEPTSNGKVLMTVTLSNHQYESTSFTVGTVDLTAPTITNHDNDSNYLYLTVDDADSGVDYENISAISAGGTTIKPVSYDEKTGVITFEYPKESLNIYIPDNAGNQLQTIITVGG